MNNHRKVFTGTENEESRTKQAERGHQILQKKTGNAYTLTAGEALQIMENISVGDGMDLYNAIGDIYATGLERGYALAEAIRRKGRKQK